MKEMMIKKTIIKKGTHAPFRIPKLILNPFVLEYKITFTESCIYNIGLDQSDINKLFGIGYFPFHHINSLRIGWNYNVNQSNISILAYWYKNRVRNWKYLASVNIGDNNTYELMPYKRGHLVLINNSYSLEIDVEPQELGYLLRPYFGGNQTAPHDIEIIGI